VTLELGSIAAARLKPHADQRANFQCTSQLLKTSVMRVKNVLQPNERFSILRVRCESAIRDTPHDEIISRRASTDARRRRARI
jgi:hypothetical protein